MIPAVALAALVAVTSSAPDRDPTSSASRS